MAQWTPLNGIDSLRREIERAFDDFGLRTGPVFRTAFLPGRAARQYPLVNLAEDRDGIYVEALAPGVDPESLNISVVDNTLSISGEKKGVAQSVKTENIHRNERAAGRFVRTLQLPVEVDAEKVSANYKDGLLLVSLPKAEKARPKHISVQVD